MLDTRESCESAIRIGWVIALVSLITEILFWLSHDNPRLSVVVSDVSSEQSVVVSDGILWSASNAIWISLCLLIDMVVVYFVRKRSRIAATAMFAFLLVALILESTEKYYLLVTHGETDLLFVLRVIFLYFFFCAMLATYAWHKKYENNPLAKPPSGEL